MRTKIIFPLILILSLHLNAQLDPLVTRDAESQKNWVNRQYSNMTVDEKIGQLFMISVASNQDIATKNRIGDLIKNYKVGGVIFSKGGPVAQAKLTNKYQKSSRIPLLIGMDAEWGLAMRLDSTYAFPWNMTLGAIQDDKIVEKVAERIGKHAKRIGVHINFAPDLDININPENPIIGNRSFGEDRENVVRKGIAFTKGLEKAGVLSSGKHFPGHGDTATDSHHALPILNFSKQRLDSIEMYPYSKLFDAGLSSVMIGHLEVPALELKEKMPASLSEQIVTGILEEQLGFKGLIFTDALNMKGVTEGKDIGQVELEAFMAGNDMLLMPQDVTAGIQKIKEAIASGKISEARLAKSVKKILKAKYKAGLHKYRSVSTWHLHEDLNTLKDDLVYEEAIENAITVVKNEKNSVGLSSLENIKIAYVKLGEDDNQAFIQELKKYAQVDDLQAKDLLSLKWKLEGYNIVIIGVHKSNKNPWAGYELSKKDKTWLQEIAKFRGSNVILSVFAKPYALFKIEGLDKVEGIVMAYQNSEIAQQKAAQVIFGALPANGKLPVTAHESFSVNTGINTPFLNRLSYTRPERVGMSSKKLKEVDRLVQKGIDSMMFPGAQVLIARRGKVIYNKGFGHPTYDSDEKVSPEHIYDLASVTKILGTLPLVMKMEEEGQITLNNTFEELIPEYANTAIKNVTVLKALSHFGRLPAWIAFYVDTLDEERKPSSEFYRTQSQPGFSTRVTDNLYLADVYTDSIYNRIGRQDLKSNRYRYSDVGYYVLKKYIEKFRNRGLDELTTEWLYKPIGASTMGYNPLKSHAVDEIIPSEEDNYFRFKTLQGDVHDMGAAMQGGVGGHAGLFSNANDVAKIMQMYLQDGNYGGVQYLEGRTIKKFNNCYFCDKNVRRGVGFDKPQLKDKGPTCGCVSRKSFGHSGFTGTYTWADPEEEIVYVFLSNRTYPSARNTLLVKSGLRTRIQRAIYNAITD